MIKLTLLNLWSHIKQLDTPHKMIKLALIIAVDGTGHLSNDWGQYKMIKLALIIAVAKQKLG